MIRKYTKLLLLLYVAFLLDSQAGAAGRMPGRFLLPQAKLDAIDTIVLKKPNILIADPLNAKIELYVKTTLPVWGTEDFDDNLIHFSGNHTYDWTVGDILSYDSPSKRYDCESTTDYYLADTLNHAHFHASYIDNDVTYDTVASFEVRYAKPMATVLAINYIDFEDETVVVNSATDVMFDINLNRAYDLVDPDGYDKIIALEARHNGGTWTLVWNDPEGIRNENFGIELGLFTEALLPGFNTIEFRAKGKCENNCEEYSEIISLQVFYLDYEDIGPKVCREDLVSELTGIPEGGYFTGEGVIDETTLFNPSQASEGTHELTYHYRVDGSTYSVPKNLEFITPPDFNLAGDLEVCFNAWDMTYAITSLTGTYDKITWDEVQGGEIQTASGDNSVVVIHWHGQGISGGETHIGKMKITMAKSSCSTTKEFLVDIGNTIAPRPAFIMLYNDNLLVCDDTSANYFVWYHNNNMLDTTKVPYYFLGAEFDPASEDEFYVMTAFEDNEAACFTKSNVYIYTILKDGAFSSVMQELPVYPNPNDGYFTVLLPGIENQDLKLIISTLTGQSVASYPVNASEIGMEYRINGREWPAGIYLLRLEGPSSSLYKKIMITK